MEFKVSIVITLMYLTTIACHLQLIKDHFLHKIRKPRNYMICERPKMWFYLPGNPPMLTCVEPIIYYEQIPVLYNFQNNKPEITEQDTFSGYDYPKPVVNNFLNEITEFPIENTKLSKYGPPVTTVETPITTEMNFEQPEEITSTVYENSITTSTIKDEDMTTPITETLVLNKTEITTVNYETTELEQTTISKSLEATTSNYEATTSEALEEINSQETTKVTTDSNSESTTIKPDTTESEIKTTTFLEKSTELPEEFLNTITATPPTTESDIIVTKIENLETTTTTGYMYKKPENVEIIQPSIGKIKSLLIASENESNENDNIQILYNVPPLSKITQSEELTPPSNNIVIISNDSNSSEDIQNNYEITSNAGYFYEKPYIPFEY